MTVVDGVKLGRVINVRDLQGEGEGQSQCCKESSAGKGANLGEVKPFLLAVK